MMSMYDKVSAGMGMLVWCFTAFMFLTTFDPLYLLIFVYIYVETAKAG